mgnify:CR=1 FL=1
MRPGRHAIFKRALFYSALFVSLLGVSGCTQSSSPGANDCTVTRTDEIATVSRVYDGDTLELSDQRIVRLVGINTPERARDQQPSQPFAEQATDALAALLPAGNQVALIFDESRHDRHGRLLAHVFTVPGTGRESVNVSAALIEQGLGFAITVPPNVRFQSCYFARENLARQSKQGVWGHTAYQPRQATRLTRNDTGFQLVKGRVTDIGKSRKNIWLDMGDHFAVKIPRQHLQYFTRMPIESLQGKQLVVRGWVSFYNQKLRVTVGHPAMITIMD